MKSPSEKKLSPQHSVLSTQHSGPSTASPRGSVIVLVVAVLALLAVIGTVYIVSARSERASTTAASSALNMDLAQKAINSMAIDVTSAGMYDAQGNLGGYAAYGPYGSHVSRRMDIPEGNPVGIQWTTATPSQPSAPFQEWANLHSRDQSWLADGIFNPLQINPGPPYYNSLSILTPGLFNPSDGQYDIPLYTPFGTAPQPNFLTTFLFPTVADSLLDRISLPVPGSGIIPNNALLANNDSYINLLPFSDASGIRYRYGIRIVDTSGMANLNVGLPYNFSSPPDGNVPLGAFLSGYNLAINLGTNGTGPFMDNSGEWQNFEAQRLPGASSPLASLPWSFDILHSDQVGPSVLPLSLFDPGDELELRSYGGFGTGLQSRPATSWPGTLGSNPTSPEPNFARNFYTAYSYSRDLMPFPWLDPALPSFDPALRPGPLLSPYTVTGMTAGTQGWLTNLATKSTFVWPPFPARVAANPILKNSTSVTSSNIASDGMVEAATNIATAMTVLPAAVNGVYPASSLPSYTPQEALAFAADYITYHNTTGWAVVKATDGTAVLELPSGPSFVDTAGICVRGVGTTPGAFAPAPLNRDYGGAGTSDLTVASEKGAVATKVYLGYAAQPFLNEVVATLHPPLPTDPVGTPIQVNDTAIELYNPYSVPLSLEGFEISSDSPTLPIAYDFTGKNLYVPAGGFFVVAYSGGALGGTIPSAAQKDTGAPHLSLDDKHIFLMRKYYPRGSTTAKWAPVDEYSIASIMTQTPTADTSYDLARSNADNSVTNNVWVATLETTESETTPVTGTGTLGTKNPHLVDANADKAPVLWDHVALIPPLPDLNGPGTETECLNNIGDFNRIMRICNEFDSATGLPIATVSQQLAALVVTPSPLVANTAMPIEASIHFDFAAPAQMYSFQTGTTAGNNATTPLVIPSLPGAYAGTASTATTPNIRPQPGDPRAVTLLECLSFVDRVSDNSIIMGDEFYGAPTAHIPFNGSSLSKLRIPGRINVNTAPPEVLASIPALAAAPQYIGAILAYRWRTTTTDVRIPLWAQPKTPLNFSDSLSPNSLYPGYGIHSMAELNIPLIQAQEALGAFNPVPGAPNLPASLDTRDALWADIFNYLTVRSDTFVVYGYLEAVKQNPRYANIFNNTTDWYTTNAPISIIDDPNDSAHATTAALIRVARKRWVAIVDRSQCNYNLGDPRNVKPRIIAIRDLPQ